MKFSGFSLEIRGDRRRKNGCFFGKLSKGEGFISDPKNYIAVFIGFNLVYFGRKFWKNVQKGGEGVISNRKNVIANLRKLMHIYKFSQKKRNEISKNWSFR